MIHFLLKTTILTSFITLIACQSTKINSSESNNEYFKIEVVQDSKVIESKKNIITLKKKPFKFKVTLYKTDGVYVAPCWDKYYYDYPADENIFKCKNEDPWNFTGCRFVAAKTGTEDKFNVNKDIYVSAGGDYQNVWFYDKELDWYRFDKGVSVENGVINASMTVENIYDIEKRDDGNFEESEYNYKIENINQDIYMVFAASHYERGKETQELQREKFILKFK